MKKFFILIFFLILSSPSIASIKENIIENLKNINNLSFKFEQNVNGKTENGDCIIQYPKKIFCTYNQKNKKILVSNGKSIVIKTTNGYYIYPIKKTPLNSILNKDFLVTKIKSSNERIIEDKFINYNFEENDIEINIFFDRKTYNLIGWQTVDLYQNLSITYLSSIIKNQKLKENIFKLPERN